MNPLSTDVHQRRTRSRVSDSNHSAYSITPTTVAAQTMSTKAQNEEGQNHGQAIDRKDGKFEVNSSQGNASKTQCRRHSLGAYNPPALVLHSSRSPKPASRRRNSEVITPSSFRVLRQENETQTSQRRGQLNKTKYKDEDSIQQNVTSLAFKERPKHGLLLNSSVGSATGAGKTFKSRELADKSRKGLRKDLNRKSNPKTNRFTKLNAEEQRNELDRRIQIFNQNMDQFNKNDATKCRKLSLEKPSNKGADVKADTPRTPRSLSLPVIFQSYSDLDFQRLSPSEKNSFESLRHCRYLRIPAAPQLTIREIFQHQNKKERVDKGNKFPRK